MAKGDIEISIDANASGAIKGFKQTESAAQRASRSIHAGAKLAAGGFLAAGAAALVLAKGAAGDQKAAVTLATQLKNTTGATKAQVAATEAWITKQGQITGITDDELRPALGRLATATGSVQKAQKLALLAQNVAIGTGKDYGTIVNALVRAQNGQVGGLSRLGIQTTKTTKDSAAYAKAQIAVKSAHLAYDAAVKKSGPSSAQAKIAAGKLKVAHDALRAAQSKTTKTTLTMGQVTKELGAKFKGQAAAQAQTLAGKMKILKTNLHEAGESIGYALIPALTTLANIAVQKVLPAIHNVGKWMSDNKPIAIAIGAAVAAFGAAFIVASVALKVYSAGATIVSAVTKTWTGIQWALNASVMGFPLLWIVAAIAAVIAAAILIVKNWDTIKAALSATWDAIKSAFSASWNAIKAAASAAWQAIKNVVSKGLDVIKTWFLNWTGPGLLIKHWDAIKNGAGNAVDWVKAKFSGLMDFFRGIPGKIGSIFSGLWHGVAEGLKSAINTVLHLPLTIPKIDTHIPGVGKVGGQTLIPALAKGGIVTRPTLALLGDNVGHREAVVPLTGPDAKQFGNTYNITVQAAPNESIDSSVPRAVSVIDLLYGAA